MIVRRQGLNSPAAANPKSELTPVERAVLLALMSAGRPLRESADIQAHYGFSVKPAHRAKLKTLGLVETTPGPWTHSLTRKGWDWAKSELESAPPKGLMGLGPLYAVLNGLHRVLSPKGVTPEQFFQEGAIAPKADRLGADLSNAAWSSADETLALALQDIPTFERVLGRYEGALSGEAGAAMKQIRLASELVLQHVRQAASLRGLQAMYAKSEQAVFDPVEFESDDPMSAGAKAAVIKSPIVKSTAAGPPIVVVRGLAEPA